MTGRTASFSPLDGASRCARADHSPVGSGTSPSRMEDQYRSHCARISASVAPVSEDVRRHALLMFRRAWARLEEAEPGSFRLIPSGALLTAIASDYEAMQGMIFGSVPSFDTIVAAIERLESRLNS